MKMFFLISLLLSSEIMLSPSALAKKNEMRVGSPTLLQVDLKEERTEQLLRGLLNESRDGLQNAIISKKTTATTAGGTSGSLVSADFELNLGADPEKCRLEYVNQLSVMDAWTECPGVPLTFLKRINERGDKGKKGFIGKYWGAYKAYDRPYPLQFKVGKLDISNVALGRPSVNCIRGEGNKRFTRCKVEIALINLSASVNFSIRSIYPMASKGIGANEALLDWSPIDFVVGKDSYKEGETENDEYTPKLSLTFVVTPDKREGSPIVFIEKETNLIIPRSSIAVTLPHHDEKKDLGDLLTSGHLNINEDIVETMLGIGSKCSPIAERLCNILDFNASVSQILNNSNKIKNINKLINEEFGLIGRLNSTLKDADLFNDGMDIPLPDTNLQDLVDFFLLYRIADSYDAFLQSLLHDKKSSHSLEEFRYLGFPLSELYPNFRASQNILVATRVMEWTKLHTTLKAQGKVSSIEVKKINNELLDIHHAILGDPTDKKEKILKANIVLQSGGSDCYRLGVCDLFSINEDISLGKEIVETILKEFHREGIIKLPIKDKRIVLPDISPNYNVMINLDKNLIDEILNEITTKSGAIDNEMMSDEDANVSVKLGKNILDEVLIQLQNDHILTVPLKSEINYSFTIKVNLKKDVLSLIAQKYSSGRLIALHDLGGNQMVAAKLGGPVLNTVLERLYDSGKLKICLMENYETPFICEVAQNVNKVLLNITSAPILSFDVQNQKLKFDVDMTLTSHKVNEAPVSENTHYTVELSFFINDKGTFDYHLDANSNETVEKVALHKEYYLKMGNLLFQFMIKTIPLVQRLFGLQENATLEKFFDTAENIALKNATNIKNKKELDIPFQIERLEVVSDGVIIGGDLTKQF